MGVPNPKTLCMELSPGLPTAPPCADLENAGPGKTTIASSPRGDRPVAADADRFSVATKLTLAVAVTALGVGGTPRRASPALCLSQVLGQMEGCWGTWRRKTSQRSQWTPLCTKAV